MATAPKFIRVNGQVYERVAAATALDTVAEIRKKFQDKIDNGNLVLNRLRQEAESNKGDPFYTDAIEDIEVHEDHLTQLTEVVEHIDAKDWDWLRQNQIISSPVHVELTKTSEPDLEAERWERKLNKPLGKTPVKDAPKFLSVDGNVYERIVKS